MGSVIGVCSEHKARIHELKTLPAPFRAIWDGTLVHDIRPTEHAFCVNDVLQLVEWDPAPFTSGLSMPYGATGRRIEAVVTFVSEGGTSGLPERLCVLSLKIIARRTA